MFVIAFAMTSVGAPDAHAGQALAKTSRKAIESARVVVDEVQETAQEFTVNVILGGRDALKRVTTLGRWTSALTERATSPIKNNSERVTWGTARAIAPKSYGSTIHDGPLAIHQHFAREIFLRLSISMDEEPVFTGSGESRPAVGLTFIRPFD
jgi:hypothetical protein